MNRNDYLKLVVFIPESHLEQVKTALFKAGAGVQGDYRHCSWQVAGTGQFRPDAGANPFLGQVGQLERVAEYRLETLVRVASARKVICELLEAHPYEEPAYELVPLVSLDSLPPE